MEQVKLKENERVDDLELKGLKIIQNKKAFCYGIDSVLLSDFSKEIKMNSKVLDLGAGNGIIGLLLCGKTENTNIVGIEIQKEICEMASRSISYNKLQNRFKMIDGDIKNIKDLVQKEEFDAVVTNPPYKKENTGLKNESETQIIARHEVKCNLEDIISASFYALKEKGNLYMINRPERLTDCLVLLRKYKIEPKIIRLVQPKKGNKPNLVLIKACKYGGEFLQVKEPIIVYNEDGSYTDELLKIYGGRK